MKRKAETESRRVRSAFREALDDNTPDLSRLDSTLPGVMARARAAREARPALFAELSAVAPRAVLPLAAAAAVLVLVSIPFSASRTAASRDSVTEPGEIAQSPERSPGELQNLVMGSDTESYDSLIDILYATEEGS